MSDKDDKGIDSLADLLKRGPEPPSFGRPNESGDAPLEAEFATAEAGKTARPEKAVPSRLEVEVIDLEPGADETEPDDLEAVRTPPPAARRPPIIRQRTPFAERKPGWLSASAGGKLPVSGEAASEVFNKALAGEKPAEVGQGPKPAAGNDGPVIDIRRLELTIITNDGPVEALADINLTVERGEFVTLIGPSGCGKTTLLRVIADLERATSGSILVNGVTPEEARQARAYGYVFQAPALYPWRTIAKNVALPLEIMGLGVIERESRIAHNLELVNLTGFERKYPWQLSGGMQQRASIARALAVEPALLLMDEPFGALDEIVRDHLNQQLLGLWAETNKTVVFVTHSIPEAVFLSTRIVVMTPRPGKIHDIIDSTLPRNRNLDIRETPEFLKIAHRVREGLRAGHSYED
jgi:NitT/TauT family transport system ATP-binding protein